MTAFGVGAAGSEGKRPVIVGQKKLRSWPGVEHPQPAPPSIVHERLMVEETAVWAELGPVDTILVPSKGQQELSVGHAPDLDLPRFAPRAVEALTPARSQPGPIRAEGDVQGPARVAFELPDLPPAQARIHQKPRLFGLEIRAIPAGTAAEDRQLHSHAPTLEGRRKISNKFSRNHADN